MSGGFSSTGVGGGASITGGTSSTFAGGNVGIIAGDGGAQGGSTFIRGGNSSAGTGGNIFISGGNGFSTIGNVYLASEFGLGLLGRVGIGLNGPTQTPTALLDITSNTSAQASLRLRNGVPPTTPNQGDIYADGNSVFYRNASGWVDLGSSASGWALTGNAGTNPAANFIGTTDAQDFRIRSNNVERMSFTSVGNVGIGTNNPLTRLQIGGRLGLIASSTESFTALSRNIYIDNSDNPFYINNGAAGVLLMQDNSIELALHPSGTANATVGSPIRNLVVGLNGIGLNTNSPIYPAHLVSGAIGYGFVHEGGGVRVGTYVNAFGGWLGTQSNDDLRLFTNDNSGNLIIQASTGHVGIGTNTPPEPLSVLGQIGWGTPNTGTNRLQSDQGGSIDLGGNNFTANPVPGGAPYIDFHFGNGLVEDYNMRIINNGNNLLSITDNTMASRLTINNGNVGIGVVSPVSRLDINGDVRLAQGSAPGVITDKLYNVGGNLFWNGTNISSGGSGWGLSGNALAGGEKLGTTNGNPLTFITNNADRMTIDPLGNVGIGTTGPATPLHVKGEGATIRMEGTTNTWMEMNLGATRKGWLGYSSGSPNDLVITNETASGNTRFINDGWSWFYTNAGEVTIGGGLGGGVGIGVDPVSMFDVGAGDIHLAPMTAPGIVTDKLYNVGGNLFWNGTNISSAGGLPPGTTGQTLRHNGITYVSNSNLTNDGTTVSVGNTSVVADPQERLRIGDGTAASTYLTISAGAPFQAGIKFLTGGVENWAILRPQFGDNSLRFTGGGGDRMVLLPNGNVGIGTTAPLSRLQLGSRFSFFSDPVDPQEIITRNIYNDGTNFRYILAGGATALTMADSRMGMFIFPPGAANDVASSPAGRLNFTTTGLVINGDSPNDVLDVRGPVYINAYAVPPGTVTDRLYNVGGSLFWNGTNISGAGFNTLNSIPKGNGLGLVPSSITDNGSEVAITSSAAGSDILRVVNTASSANVNIQGTAAGGSLIRLSAGFPMEWIRQSFC